VSPLTVGPGHHIRLSVNDLERSKAFYTELLGASRWRWTACPRERTLTTSCDLSVPDGIQLELTAPL
jgi:predicted enzyme related to lactoylglutathione lyase